ncbi:MAG: hypothetical protein FWF21_12580, partial [Micrococcales bacterium]|nr:hypothetical protein [Micrococcales bacterium]
MKIGLKGTLTVAVAATALLATALPASAGNPDKGRDEKCTPKAAWVEVIPAKGTPWTVVTISPAVPGVDAVYRYVDHPAVTKEVTTTTYQRYQWNPGGNVASGQTPDVTGSNPKDNPGEWQASTTNHKNEPVGAAYFESKGNGGNGGAWVYWVGTTKTDTVVEKAAWTEKITVTPAVAPVPAVTKKVKNASYEPKQVIKHQAVVCDKNGKKAKNDKPQGDHRAKDGKPQGDHKAKDGKPQGDHKAKDGKPQGDHKAKDGKPQGDHKAKDG